MTTSKQMNKTFETFETSLSKILQQAPSFPHFEAPSFPHFGGKASEDTYSKVSAEDESAIMGQRLALRLSTPADKTRSSRKSRMNKGKPMSDQSNITVDFSIGTTANSTAPNDSSCSSIDDDDIDIANRMNQIQIQKETFDGIKQQLEDELKHGKPIQPRRSASPDRMPDLPKLRRAKSDVGSSLIPKATEAKNATSTPKARKASVMSGRSMSSARTPRKSGGMGDHSRKIPRVNSKESDATATSRRTMSNKSGSGRNVMSNKSGSHGNVSNSRRSSKRNLNRESKPAKGSPKAKKETQLSWNRGRANTDALIPVSTPDTQERNPVSIASATPVPEGSWACVCGSVLRGRMNFCGYCGCKKHWTCEDCQFNENLCGFKFCGDCGELRAEGSSTGGSDPIVRLSPPKLVTMFE